MSKYKYIKDGFPYLENENVFEYDNIFNYNQWGENTIIRVMHVPWDRDYSNVVIFDDKNARDRWAEQNTVTQYQLTTAINVQADGTIKLPIPFDVLAKCNYIVVEYAYAPVDYETDNRISKMGYFIDNVMQQAPSTTQARVSLDYWYTFIYDIDITYLDLERGHAPMAATSADYYLQNPINRNEYLLTPDVNFSNDDRNRIKQAAEWIANEGDILTVFACTGNVSSAYWGTTGTRDMQTPGVAASPAFGIRSGYDYIAVNISDLDLFIAQCNGARPQWLQTVQGMFFVPKKLVNITHTFKWSNVDPDLYFIDTSQQNYNILDLDKDNFNYDDRYKDIAKLYTYPYCHLEITDENGNTSTVYVENTTGKLGIKAALNLIWPFVGLDIIPAGIGDDTEITSQFGWSGNRLFKHAGDWYSIIKRYEIPAFIVSQSQNDRAKFNRYFQNSQDNTALENTYTSTLASNQTGYDNTIASNLTGYNNTIASNLTNYNIAERDRGANYTNVLNSINTNADIALEGNRVAWDDGAVQLLLSKVAYDYGLANDLITTFTSTVSSIASAPASPGTAVNTALNAVSFPLIMANNIDVFNAQYTAGEGHLNRYFAVPSPTQGQAEGYGYYSTTHTQTAQTANENRTNIAQIADNNDTKTTGDANALASKNTGDANALASKNTGDANAGRTRATALAAIDNGNRAQGVEAPAVYGNNSGSSTAASRPLGLFVNIATQSKAAIKAAGDQFLRYGYMLEQAWTPEQWQVMKHFTYWKARDIWISGRGITIEDATETIKNIFINGTTIWDNPSDVGNVSIYDNI